MINSINIEDYLSNSKFTTREELVKKTGLSDRRVRDLISSLKEKRVVIYSSSIKGYKLAKAIKSMPSDELKEELDLVNHSLNDCKSRTRKLNKEKRKYIAYLKKAEQIRRQEEAEMIKNNMNHIPQIDY